MSFHAVLQCNITKTARFSENHEPDFHEKRAILIVL